MRRVRWSGPQLLCGDGLLAWVAPGLADGADAWFATWPHRDGALMSEHATEAAARAWCVERARERGYRLDARTEVRCLDMTIEVEAWEQVVWICRVSDDGGTATPAQARELAAALLAAADEAERSEG